jgi:hypothetical protein
VVIIRGNHESRQITQVWVHQMASGQSIILTHCHQY